MFYGSRRYSASYRTGKKKILRLIAQGLSNKEIALKLGIKPVTVEFHIKNLFSKLNVHSRVEAAVLAEKSGLA